MNHAYERPKHIGRWQQLRMLLGVVALCIAPLWVYVVKPTQLKIADDFSQSVEVNSFDNLYDPTSGAYAGEQQSTTRFSYQTVAHDGGELTIRNTFDVRSLSGDSIFRVARLYGIDAYSGMHVASGGDREREGYLFAPRMRGFARQEKDRAPFDYWHANYDVPIHMEYRDQEVLFGVPVYRYESNFSADQTQELTDVLPDVGDTKGVVLDAHLNMWVEPYTGRIVQYSDYAEAFFYDLETGERLYPWNKFRNQTAPASVAHQARLAASTKEEVVFIGTGAVLLFFLLGIVLLVYPFAQIVVSRGLDRVSGNKKNLIIPFFVSSMILCFTGALAYVAFRITQEDIKAEFNAEAIRLGSVITDRLGLYANILSGSRGLFDASEEVSREEWATYVESIDIRTNYPGIQGVGFIRIVESDTTEAFVEEIKNDGFPSFSIVSDGNRPLRALVTFIEPFDARNQGAFGYDVFSDPVRQQAMIYARDVGSVAISGKIQLIQNDDEVMHGFAMYEPVFRPRGEVATLNDRRANLYGFVYAPFRLDNFMIGIFSRDETALGVEVFDGSNPGALTDDRRIYRSSRVVDDPVYTQVITLDVYNHMWTVRFSAPNGFGFNFFRDGIPGVIGVSGALLAVLVFLVMYVINTRRVQAMLLAGEMTQNLQHEKARTEAFLAGIGEGLYATDASGHIVFVNDAFETILGFSKTELLGKKISDVVTMVRKDGTPVDDGVRPINRTIRTEHEMEVSSVEGWSYKHKDGRLIPITVVTSPIVLEDTLVGAVEVFRDVTREQEIDRAKSELVSLASHQLRTPITAINWYSEILLDPDTGKLTKDQQTYFGEIRAASQRMSRLINALLNVSRLELGTFSITPQERDVADIITTVIKDQEPEFVGRKQHVSFVPSKTIAPIPVDFQLLYIIVQNLLSNASKYSPEGAEIEMRLDATEKFVTITCQDHGYGIPAHQQDRIFQKLFRADNVQKRNVEGTGLGLYIIKTIVDASGCALSFASKEDEGTTFVVSIPRTGMRSKGGTRQLTTNLKTQA